MDKGKVTINTVREMKEQGKKIAMLTAYDFPFARLMDEAGIDIVLVGDSLGNVILGYPNTLPVTMEDIIRHSQAVTRACRRTMVVADMPFMSYQVSVEAAVSNAGRLMKEGNAEAVKLEGGVSVADRVKAIVDAGIPVMGHVGLTPQSVYKLGGFKVQGRGEAQSEMVLNDARAVQEAGAFAVVVETVPSELGKRVTAELRIPTIGIGAGPHCDGQVLISYDMLGIYQEFHPKFAKRYAEIGAQMMDAFKNYIDEVRGGKFPSDQYSYK